IVQPVVIDPWLREWEGEKVALGKLLSSAKARKTKTKTFKPARERFNDFSERLRAFTVLDPACGSGNFLYLALRALKDIEKRVLVEGEALGLGRQFPGIGPKSVKGIELNANHALGADAGELPPKAQRFAFHQHALFNVFQGAQSQIQEVAAAAGRVKHGERA